LFLLIHFLLKLRKLETKRLFERDPGEMKLSLPNTQQLLHYCRR
jgi:hypothetical protein